jgi:hypothetical protein
MMDSGLSAVDAVAGVDHLAVDLAGQRGLGQTGANRRSDLGHRDRAGKFAFRAVGKRDVNHGESRKELGTKKARTGRA